MGRKNIRLWLVTWEGDHGRENNIALLLPATTAEGRVAELVALLYANERGTLAERLAQAVTRNDAERPYRARCASPEGERAGHFVCGENPWLYARRVERAAVDTGEDGAKWLRWSELPEN